MEIAIIVCGYFAFLAFCLWIDVEDKRYRFEKDLEQFKIFKFSTWGYVKK